MNVGHLQVVYEALNDKLYLHVSGGFTVCGVGWGARSRFVFVEGLWIGSKQTITPYFINHLAFIRRTQVFAVR